MIQLFKQQIKDDAVSMAIRQHKTASPEIVLKGYGISPEDPISKDILTSFYLSNAFYEHSEDKKRRDDKYSLRHKYEGAVRPDKRSESHFSLSPYMKVLYTAHDWGEDIVKSIVGAIVMEHFVKNRFPGNPDIQTDHHLVTNHYGSVWKRIMKKINSDKDEVIPFDLMKKSSILPVIEGLAATLEQQVDRDAIEKSFDSINDRLVWFQSMFNSLWTHPDYQCSPNLKLDNIDTEGYCFIRDTLDQSIDILAETRKETEEIHTIAYKTGEQVYQNIHDIIDQRALSLVPSTLLSENESPLEARIKKTIYEDLYLGRMIKATKIRLGEVKEDALAAFMVKICDATDNVSQLPTSIEKLYTTVRKARAVIRQAFKLSQWMYSRGYSSSSIQHAASYLNSRLISMVKSHRKLYGELARIETLYDEDTTAYEHISDRLNPLEKK